jgi:hypothetical protein
MNELLTMLSGGDLRYDGRANEVAEQVIKRSKLLGKLTEGLNESNGVIRARTAHALEITENRTVTHASSSCVTGLEKREKTRCHSSLSQELDSHASRTI